MNVTQKDEVVFSITPGNGKFHGTKLMAMLRKHHSRFLDDNLVNENHSLALRTRTKFGNSKHSEGTTDLRVLRAEMPFLDPPSPPIYRSNLPEEVIRDIEFVNESLTGHRLSKQGSECLSRLVDPSLEDFAKLYVAGGTQSVTKGTALKVIEALKITPKKSVLLECGSGAPALALILSLWTKVTICVDRPMVMDEIFKRMALMSPELMIMPSTLHYVSADILDMRPHHFSSIGDGNILNEITHLTAFIGLNDVNDALVKFALKCLPSLEWMCFRGDLLDVQKDLLAQFGFVLVEDQELILTLDISCMFYFLFFISHFMMQ